MKIKFMKQKMMRKVIYALIPLILAGIYFYGWRTLVLLISVTLAGCLVEWIFVRKTTKKITEAVVVTSILYTLTLPPNVPFYIAIIGIIFGVLFGKMVFGGFGKNPFNPALVGRAFIYVNFPRAMTMEWIKPSTDLFGNLNKFSVDVISQSTPLLDFRSSGDMLNLKDVFSKDSSFDYSLYNTIDKVHKLSHQHLYTKFWIIEVDELPKDAIPISSITDYPTPVLISDFINVFTF